MTNTLNLIANSNRFIEAKEMLVGQRDYLLLKNNSRGKPH